MPRKEFSSRYPEIDIEHTAEKNSRSQQQGSDGVRRHRHECECTQAAPARRNDSPGETDPAPTAVQRPRLATTEPKQPTRKRESSAKRSLHRLCLHCMRPNSASSASIRSRSSGCAESALSMSAVLTPWMAPAIARA